VPLLGKEEAGGPAEAAMKTAEDQLLMRLSDEASGGSSPTSTEADTMPLLAAGDFNVGRSNSAGKQGLTRIYVNPITENLQKFLV
jgi:hypothetical protein